MAIHIEGVDDFKNRLSEAGEKLVVIDFTATWCERCKMIEPILEELANEMADSIVVLKVDVEECKEIVAEYDITTTPTFFFMRNSHLIKAFHGANVDKLKNTILKLK